MLRTVLHKPRGSILQVHARTFDPCQYVQWSPNAFFVVLFFFPLLFRVSGVLSCLFADVPHKPNSQSQIKHWVLQNFVDTRFLKVVHGSVVASLFKAISLGRACSDILTEKAIPPTFARPGIGARKLVLLVWFQSQ